MSKDRLTYVIDTNVLVDYVDIIPSPESPGATPEEPTIDLTGAHLVIPTAVIRELSSFKKEKSERGKVARVALKRIRGLTEGRIESMGDIYHLGAPLLFTQTKQTLSILPVHKNFKKALPFSPSEDDMDGQIILATLTVAFIENGLPIDGTADPKKVENLRTDSVTLITNDNGLAIRARERGLNTERYGYKYPEPYTGRRDIVVPKELFLEFYNGGRIERALFEELMPGERELVANEFIVMRLEDPADYPRDFDPNPLENPYFFHVGRYDIEEEAIVRLKYATRFPVRLKNPGQAIYAEALMDPNISAVICTGPAGSGKTYMATIYGYHACQNGEFLGVTAVPCENRSRLGALPGDLDEKMDPDVQPLKNALRNYLINDDTKFRKEIEELKKYGATPKVRKSRDADEDAPARRSVKIRLKDRVDQIWEGWFSSVPIENARGRDFSHELAIYDEFQDQNAAQADTLIKRIGADGKIVLTGDVEQIHAPYLDKTDNGLVYASRQLFDNPMVAQVCFVEDEVIRHPLVKLIATRQKTRKDED